MPHFGPKVIGQEQFEKEKAVEASGSLMFGPKVLGKKKPAATEPPPATTEPPVEPVEGPSEPDDSVSVRELKDLLREHKGTATIDRLMTAEFVRPDGSRKTALSELLAAEERRDAPRAEVIEALKSKLEEVG